MTPDVAQQLLEKTQRDYEALAELFAEKRAYPWEEMHDWVRIAKNGDAVLDAGCGHGRLFPLLRTRHVTYTGIDFSERLLNLARSHYPEGQFLLGSLLTLPFENQTFNLIYCIATFHHIPSYHFQRQVVQEFSRVLQPDGEILLTTWNVFQPKYLRHVLWGILLKLVWFRKFEWLDCFVPWKDSEGRTIAKRYVHAFTMRKLKKLFKQSGFDVSQCAYTKNGEPTSMWKGLNIVIRAQKVGKSAVESRQ